MLPSPHPALPRNPYSFGWLLLYVAKLLLGSALLYVLYQQIGSFGQLFAQLPLLCSRWGVAECVQLGFVLALCCINWAIEAAKWQLLMRQVCPISYYLALRSVLTGTAWAIVTPNRLGEYGGRSVLLPKHQWAAAGATLRGNLAQLCSNMVLGGAAFVAFSRPHLELNTVQQVLFYTILISLVAVLLLFYYRTHHYAERWQQWAWWQRWVGGYRRLPHYTTQQLHVVMLLSAVRWVVFALPYMVLLQLLGIGKGVSVVQLWSAVGSIYLVQTVLPAITFVEIGVRGNTALFFLGKISAQPSSILLSSFGLWCINLLLPALAGAIIWWLHSSASQR